MDFILKSEREEIEEKIERLKARRMKVKNKLTTERMKDVYERLAEIIDDITIKNKKEA